MFSLETIKSAIELHKLRLKFWEDIRLKAETEYNGLTTFEDIEIIKTTIDDIKKRSEKYKQMVSNAEQ